MLFRSFWVIGILLAAHPMQATIKTTTAKQITFLISLSSFYFFSATSEVIVHIYRVTPPTGTVNRFGE